METMTREALDEMMRLVEKVVGPAAIAGFSSPFGGLPIHENPYLTETETYSVPVELTARQRWIDPLLHPVVMPFEPWVKTRVETRTREIPSRQIFQTSYGLFMHPAMRREVEKKLRNMTEDIVPPYRNLFGF